MSATSPPPNSTPSAVAPVSTTPPPSQPSSPPPAPPPTPPSSLPSANPPESPPSTNATSPPPTSPSAPPPQPPVTSPPPPVGNPLPPTTSPPPQPVSPPPANPPPPQPVSPPPANPPPPPSNSPTPPSSNPPESSPPPPPPSVPPPSLLSPPPPSSTPPASPPPPPSSNPPASSPPPPSSEPPQNSHPPPPPNPPQISPPPPSSRPPPQSSPPSPEKASPPPGSKPPENSPPRPPSNPPPPPSTAPPGNSPPPQSRRTPPSASPPATNSPPESPPPPITQLSPPPPSVGSPPPLSPSPPQVPIPPPGNSTNNSPSSNSPSNSNSLSGRLGTGGAVAIGLVLAFILLTVIGTAAWCMRKRKKKDSGFSGGYVIPTSMGSSLKSESALLKMHAPPPSGSSTGSDFVHSPAEPGGLGNSRSWFTYAELVKATNGFSAENLLGEGGFGSVYKGYISDGTEVAVKQLKIGGGQGEREFRAEVEIISRIHHRHLVSLVGYCISDNRRLLVYEYVPNNTLYFHLHGNGRPVMDWATRVKIAAGAARGIAYLHEDCHPRIIHRDIKSSNILLDNNFEARVADFGLAKLALDANTHITTRVMGTFGYMAPEYASSGKLTDKSDVYSYGVVLLELITGRKPVDASQPLGEESLVEWARPLLSNALDTEQFEGLADPRLERNYVDGEMFRMIEAAAACVRHSAAKRPRMGQIVRAFDNMAMADLTNGMRLGESQIFNSAQQSAEVRLFRRMAFGSQGYSTDFFSQSSWND